MSSTTHASTTAASPLTTTLRTTGTGSIPLAGTAIWLASPASGDGDVTGVTTGPTAIAVSSVSHSGSPQGGGGTGSASVYSGCVDLNLVLQAIMPGIDGWLGTSHSTVTESSVAYRSCTRISDSQPVGWVTGLLGAAAADVVPTAQDLVAQAMARMTIALPDVATSPPRSGVQLVGVPVWFWVNNYRPVSVTAAIPGLSATLIATPTKTVITPGDDTSVTCSGPGVEYDPMVSYKDQKSTCSHVYDQHGPYTAAVTVTWALTWTASDGQAGTLPVVDRIARFPLRIQEAEAVTD